MWGFQACGFGPLGFAVWGFSHIGFLESGVYLLRGFSRSKQAPKHIFLGGVSQLYWLT